MCYRALLGARAALGHNVRLMAPSYVKPYVKRQKNDAADAEAICEAVGRPTMRFVAVKTVEQQSVMVLHRTPLLLMRADRAHRQPPAPRPRHGSPPRGSPRASRRASGRA